MRSSLRNFLRTYSDHMVVPWAIIEDFNTILHESDRNGGVEYPSHRVVRAFRKVMEYCHLLDARFEGPNFTWSRGDLSMRLDRLIMNQAWRLQFPRAIVTHLYQYKSDHKHLLLNLDVGVPPNKRISPFRF